MLSIVEGIFDERVLWLMENGWMKMVDGEMESFSQWGNQ